MPLELSFFSDPVILPQIIPNCHNRILTHLHAILYFHSYNHPQTYPKRRQHSAGTRESALYAFHPPTRARAFIPGAIVCYIISSLIVDSITCNSNTAHNHPAPQIITPHHRQQPPATDANAAMMTTARGGGERSHPARLVPLLRRSMPSYRTIHRMIQLNENATGMTE